MDDSTKRKSSKKPVMNQELKNEIVRKKLAEFFTAEIVKDNHLKKYFNTESVSFLGAGAFGHVFLLTARKDLTYEDLEELTLLHAKDEKHSVVHQVEPLHVPDKTQLALKKNTGVAFKCETAFELLVENFPLTARTLPEPKTERLALYKEYNALNSIFTRYGFKDTRGFTRPYAFGHLSDITYTEISENKKVKMFAFHFLIFEMCGPDMEEMLNICSYDCRQNDQRLSTRTVFMIGDQFLSRLQCIQEPTLGFAHNDLKSDQLMAGKGENANTIYLIDYGLVCKYKETYTSSFVEVVGNRRWAPRSSHQRKPRTPLCEIESACYVLLRLLKNSFPWDGMHDRQAQRIRENKDHNEGGESLKDPEDVLYDEKQCLWYYLQKESGKKLAHMSEDVEQAIEKYKEFFDERDDKWGDGGSQMKDMMVDMAKMGDPIYCGFWERKIDYEDLNYIGLRKHLLNIFDLSMYAHTLETSGLTGRKWIQVDSFFKENQEKSEQRTECGRPVYYYFPEGEQHCYWEWYCRSKDFWENKHEYWHKVLANREELAELLRQRQSSGQKSRKRK